MKTRVLTSLLVSVFVAAASMAGAPSKSSQADVGPPEHRRTTIDSANRLAHPVAPAPLPADLASPFSPADFDKPDPSEAHDKTPAASHASDAKTAPAAPATDREVLEAVAAKIPTTGTIILDGKPLLVSGTNRLQIGSSFTVVYNGQEYELELVAINRTTFTLRYRGEEFTRPIKLGRTP